MHLWSRAELNQHAVRPSLSCLSRFALRDISSEAASDLLLRHAEVSADPAAETRTVRWTRVHGGDLYCKVYDRKSKILFCTASGIDVGIARIAVIRRLRITRLACGGPKAEGCT